MKKSSILVPTFTLFAALLAALLAGCATTLECVPLSEEALKDSNKNAAAIPYYLPKPYLIVTRNVNATGAKKTTIVKTDPSKDTETKTTVSEPVEIKGAIYSYQVVYLPDLRYKYGLRYHQGTGSYDTSFSLENGWMFTGLNAKGDAKTPETLAAIGKLAESLALAADSAVRSPAGTEAAPVTGVTGSEPKIWIYEVVLKTVDGKNVMTFQPAGAWDPGK